VAIVPVEVLWTLAVGIRVSGPFVVADRLILAQDDSLKALDPATASVIWSVDLGAAGDLPFAALTARGDVVYGFLGRMVAVRVGDAEVLWSMPPPSGGILAADAERLYVIGPGSIAALDPDSGTVLWEASVPEPFGVTAVGAGVVCVAGESILCYDGEDGRLLWSARFDSSIVVDLDVGTGRAVASTLSGTVVAHDPRSGTVVWRRSLGSSIRGTAIASSKVHVCHGGAELEDAGACVALEESNGEERWTVGTRGPTSTPVVREGAMVVVDSRAILQVDSGTGEIVRRVALPRPDFHLARLAYHEGVLYALLFGELHAVRVS
jgi:outer membrane protein assembly factor BamB